ncbi:hypothetical protein O159_24270 [Leifsonia xyli subsp. cynodontis DSM 46306]|uniref:Septum formation-related domain-containing protein n=1 Tax=Leifsonia xyli subsp. cynodontis DSM 46306 TaxID=1389489 RepID=U3PA57_LEIXC|nr:hypothetical protein O159_24270 [Leifsonia xyli subsp. cynodontis DSM 46306]
MPPRQPATHLASSIVSTALFWPVGIAAILKSVAARRALAAQDLPAATAAGKSARTLAIVGTCIGSVLLLVSVVMTIAVTTASLHAAESEDAVSDASIDVEDLDVGDCLALPASGIASTVELLDCAGPHTAEVFHTFEMAGAAAFPGAEAVKQAASEACTGEAFAQYIGAETDASGYSINYFGPTSASWSMQNRGITCFLVSAEEGGELTGSARG